MITFGILNETQSNKKYVKYKHNQRQQH